MYGIYGQFCVYAGGSRFLRFGKFFTQTMKVTNLTRAHHSIFWIPRRFTEKKNSHFDRIIFFCKFRTYPQFFRSYSFIVDSGSSFNCRWALFRLCYRPSIFEFCSNFCVENETNKLLQGASLDFFDIKKFH